MHTSKNGRLVRAVAFIGLGVASMIAPVGCDTQPHRGPMEQAGHDIDHAAQHVQHDVDHAGHQVDHSVHNATH